MAKAKSAVEIKKLLKETKSLSNKEAAKHIGISIGTLYKWKEKAKQTPAKKATPNKKLAAIVKSLKSHIARLEKEI